MQPRVLLKKLKMETNQTKICFSVDCESVSIGSYSYKPQEPIQFSAVIFLGRVLVPTKGNLKKNTKENTSELENV